MEWGGARWGGVGWGREGEDVPGQDETGRVEMGQNGTGWDVADLRALVADTVSEAAERHQLRVAGEGGVERATAAHNTEDARQAEYNPTLLSPYTRHF